jgi:hypothetical protein
MNGEYMQKLRPGDITITVGTGFPMTVSTKLRGLEVGLLETVEEMPALSLPEQAGELQAYLTRVAGSLAMIREALDA